jgi:molybdopterin-binding protein
MRYSDNTGPAAHGRKTHTMRKLSARNQIAGTIKAVKPGATTTHVTIEVSPSVTITASITNEASEELRLKPGMKATAVIKASDVMVGVD